jgi:hypothetical protein
MPITRLGMKFRASDGSPVSDSPCDPEQRLAFPVSTYVASVVSALLPVRACSWIVVVLPLTD